MLPSGTVTFLFTDIQGSTQLWDSFPDEMRAALKVHDAIVTEAVAASDGHIVKNTGDGQFAAFATADSAVRAAIGIQLGLRRQEWDPAIGSLAVRVAMHTDEVEPVDDDYHGTAINRVARIEAAGHGGQVLLSDATAALVDDTLPDGVDTIDLGTHLLRGLTTPERIHQLVVPELPEAFPPLRTATTAAARLPEIPTSFVGRATDLEDIVSTASDPSHRILTLVGPGGIGKTRLAVESARRIADESRAVAHFLGLAPLASIDAVVKALADSLDFTIDLHALSASFTEKTQVFDRLAMHPTVLVLDNYEHLIAYADFVGELTTEVPDTTVIITSRERLGLQGEWVYEVEGLSDDGDDDAPTLFVERAVQAGGTADTEDPGVRRVCDLVGGMPLAIELAAAWTPVLSPGEIAAEIAANLDFLAAELHDLPDRHRSLRAAFDSSWRRLDDAAQQAFASLGVFPSAFTREAASVITKTPLPVLFDLLKKSLVHRSAIDRFDLHPMVREFARDRLGGRRAGLEEAHARHYGAFLLERSSDLAGSLDQVGVRDEVADELDHVLAAAEWYVRHRDAVDPLPILEGLLYFYFLHSWSEGAETMARLASIAKDDVGESEPFEDEAYRTARLYHVEFAQNFVEPAGLTDELTRMLPVWERVGGRGLAWCLTLLGDLAIIAGDTQEALGWFDRAEPLSEELDPLGQLTLAAWHGWTQVVAGEAEAGHRIFAEGEARARIAGAELGRAYLLSKLGVSSDELGEHEAASDFHRQADEVFVKFDDIGGQAYVASRLSWTSYLSGDYEMALRYALDGLEKFESVNHRWGMAASRCRAGLAEIELGRIEDALRRFREALALAQAAGMREVAYYALTGIGRAWVASANDHDAAVLLAFTDVEANPYREFATPALEAVAERLGQDQMEALSERASDMDLEGAVALAQG